MLYPFVITTRSGWNSMRLFLCEKPSQGKDIGKVLGATQRDNGCLKGPGVIVTWCIGHLVEAAPPEAYDAQLKHWSIEQLRSEEHTSELQSLMRSSYAVFCLQKKKHKKIT